MQFVPTPMFTSIASATPAVIPITPPAPESGPPKQVLPDRLHRLKELSGVPVNPIVLEIKPTLDNGTLEMIAIRSRPRFDKPSTGFLGPSFDKNDADLFIGVL